MTGAPGLKGGSKGSLLSQLRDSSGAKQTRFSFGCTSYKQDDFGRTTTASLCCYLIFSKVKNRIIAS